MICALLVFQSRELPDRLSTISPWLDSNELPIETVVTELDRQQHRRIIKSHTPVDGIPTLPGVTVVAGARHPLDAAVSWYHYLRNLDLPP